MLKHFFLQMKFSMVYTTNSTCVFVLALPIKYSYLHFHVLLLCIGMVLCYVCEAFVSKYLLGISFTKDSGMTNIVDPNQTAPEGASLSGSALFAYGI